MYPQMPVQMSLRRVRFTTSGEFGEFDFAGAEGATAGLDFSAAFG
jgi:hypothetical protein